MSITPGELYHLSNEQLLERMSGAQVGSQMVQAVELEFQRRLVVASIEAANAQLGAANAARDSAKWTKWSAIFIGLSVGVMTAGVIIDAWQP